MTTSLVPMPLASTTWCTRGLSGSRSHNDEDHRVIFTRFLAEHVKEDGGGRSAGTDERRGRRAVQRAVGRALHTGMH